MDVGGVLMYSFEWDQYKSKINQSKEETKNKLGIILVLFNCFSCE